MQGLRSVLKTETCVNYLNKKKKIIILSSENSIK